MRPSNVVERNRAEWAVWAEEYVESAERSWAQEEITWGLWDAREADLQATLRPYQRDGIACGYSHLWHASNLMSAAHEKQS